MNDFGSNYNNSEPLLPPMLAEFRDALKDEIEVAKRNSSSSAIPLSKQHRQKIFKSHLRLPKMAALIPKKEHKKVCKLLGIETFGEISAPLSISQAQMDFFDKVAQANPTI